MDITNTAPVTCECGHPRHHHHIGAQRPCAVAGCECADYTLDAIARINADLEGTDAEWDAATVLA